MRKCCVEQGTKREGAASSSSKPKGLKSIKLKISSKSSASQNPESTLCKEHKKKLFKSKLPRLSSISSGKSTQSIRNDANKNSKPDSQSSAPQSPSLKRVKISAGKSWRSSLEELRDAKTKFCSSVNHAIGAIGKRSHKSSSREGKNGVSERCTAPVLLSPLGDRLALDDDSRDLPCENSDKHSKAIDDCSKLLTDNSLSPTHVDGSLSNDKSLHRSSAGSERICVQGIAGGECSSSCINESPLRRVKGRSGTTDVISDCTLYGTDHVQAVLKVLRSSLDAEKKLCAIKYSHDYWEKLEKGEIDANKHPYTLDYILSQTGDKNTSICRSHTSPCIARKSSQRTDEIGCRTTNDDGNVNEKDMRNSSESKKTECYSINVQLIEGERNAEASARVEWSQKHEGKEKIGLNLNISSASKHLHRPLLKSPVSIQEWVDSISVNDVTKQTDDMSSNQHNQASSGPLPLKLPSHDDDEFILGAEAKLLDEPINSTCHLQPSLPPVQVESSQVGKNEKRLPLSVINKQCSFNSELSGYSAISRVSAVSSVDALLNMRKEDPEEILQSLGFCALDDPDSFSRIPQRFLAQPSMAKGLEIDNFLNQCGFENRLDAVNGNDVQETFPVEPNHHNILSRMSSRASLQRKSSSLSMVSDTNLSDLLSQRNLIKLQGDSILNQENREFLESQKQSMDSPTKKRLILGSQMFCLSQDGELLLEDSLTNASKENDQRGKEDSESNRSTRRSSRSYDDLSSNGSTIQMPFSSYRLQSLSSIGRQRRFSSCDNLPVTEEEVFANETCEENLTSSKNPIKSNLSLESIFCHSNVEKFADVDDSLLDSSGAKNSTAENNQVIDQPFSDAKYEEDGCTDSVDDHKMKSPPEIRLFGVKADGRESYELEEIQDYVKESTISQVDQESNPGSLHSESSGFLDPEPSFPASEDVVESRVKDSEFQDDVSSVSDSNTVIVSSDGNFNQQMKNKTDLGTIIESCPNNEAALISFDDDCESSIKPTVISHSLEVYNDVLDSSMSYNSFGFENCASDGDSKVPFAIDDSNGILNVFKSESNDFDEQFIVPSRNPKDSLPSRFLDNNDNIRDDLLHSKTILRKLQRQPGLNILQNMSEDLPKNICHRTSLSSIVSSDSNNESLSFGERRFSTSFHRRPDIRRKVKMRHNEDEDFSFRRQSTFYNSEASSIDFPEASPISARTNLGLLSSKLLYMDTSGHCKLDPDPYGRKTMCKNPNDDYGCYQQLMEVIKKSPNNPMDQDSDVTFSEDDYHGVSNYQRVLHETDVLHKAICCFKEDFQKVENASLHKYRQIYAELPSEYRVEISAIQDIRQSITREMSSIQKLLAGRSNRLLRYKGPLTELTIRSTDIIHDMTLLLRQQRKLCDELEKLEYAVATDSCSAVLPSQLSILKNDLLSKQTFAQKEIYSSLEQMKSDIIEEVKKSVSSSLIQILHKESQESMKSSTHKS